MGQLPMTKLSDQMLNFSDLIAPFPDERFFSTYHDKQHLHIQASLRDKFASIMTWQILSDILNMTSIWSATSLTLVMDRETLQAEQYCNVAIGRDGQQVAQPDTGKVKDWLQRGATLIANDIDALVPEVAFIADTLEKELGAKAQCNLYLSLKGQQGFHTHFDFHEVFALHIIGQKADGALRDGLSIFDRMVSFNQILMVDTSFEPP